MSTGFMNDRFDALGSRSLKVQIAENKKALIEMGYRESDFAFLLSGFVPLHVANMALRKAVAFHQAKAIEKGEAK